VEEGDGQGRLRFRVSVSDQIIICAPIPHEIGKRTGSIHFFEDTQFHFFFAPVYSKETNRLASGLSLATSVVDLQGRPAPMHFFS
jgi:hypothetical protein